MRDCDIRAVLLRQLHKTHGKDGSLILQEMGLLEGASRVDVAVINGVMHGYEIKSERDTLDRLAGQRDAYGRCFDRVTLLVADKHLDAAIAAVPIWWGITVARAKGKSVRLEPVRKGGENPDIAPATIVRLLWRDEARKALASRGIGSDLRAKRRHELWRLLADSLPLDDLRGIVREALKTRGDWITAKRQARYSDSPPSSSTMTDYQANLD